MRNYFKKSTENLIRNWTSVVPSILVMAIVLTLFHSLLVVHGRAQETLNAVQDKFSITIYLKDDADPFGVGNLINRLEQRADVKTPVIYTSKEAAWQAMSEAFSLDKELLKKYQFSLPASLTIMPKNPDAAEAIEAFIQTNAAQLLKNPLTSKDKQKNTAAQMLAFIQTIKDSTLHTLIFFIVLFIIGGALLISSTIHMAINSRHREISIMKLVGASRSTICTPFVIEGFLIAAAAFALHVIMLLILPLDFAVTKMHFNALILEFIAIAFLGAAASYITTLFHIRTD